MKEFSRTRRNRMILTTFIFALGFVTVVLPDVEAGSLEINSLVFLVILAIAYYRILGSKRREQEGIESFPAIAGAIQRIKNDSRGLTRVVGYYAMPDGWLIKKSLLTFDFVSTSDICWVYGKNTKHYVNFIIPTHTERSLIVKLRSGRTLSESYRNKARDEKLAILRREAPWAVFGYSEQLENAWHNDRETFATEVGRRHRVSAS